FPKKPFILVFDGEKGAFIFRNTKPDFIKLIARSVPCTPNSISSESVFINTFPPFSPSKTKINGFLGNLKSTLILHLP
ncbi:MAG: hypothetical protein AAFU64_16700, partial [Bacteroidota bacterium]